MRYYDVCSTGNLDMILAVLQPYTGRFLLHLSANLFHDSKITTDEVSDIKLKELAKIIIEDHDDLNCIRRIDVYFLKGYMIYLIMK